MRVRPIFLVLVLAACDSGPEGNPPSRFDAVSQREAATLGKVRRDREWVEGAVVRIESSNISPLSMTTNGFGWYRFDTSPARYDLSILDGRELTVFRDMKSHYVEPLLAGTAAPRAFSAWLDVVPDDPVPANQKLVFAVSGTEVVGISGDGPTNLTLAFRPYELLKKPDDTTCLSGVILHVIQIANGGSLATPLAYGSQCLDRVVANERRLVGVKLVAVEQKPVDFTVTAVGPANMVADPVELAVDFGDPKVTLPVARFTVGTTTSLVRIPQARYSVRMRARKDRVVTDSGLTFIEPEDKSTVLELPAPPEVSLPGLGDGGAMVFDVTSGPGVRELALVPAQAGAPTVRIVGTDARVVVPDLGRMGLPPLAGRYSVSVRQWAKLASSDALGGPYARDVGAFADSAGYDFTAP